MAKPIVLVTGLSDLIGSALRRQLSEDAYELRGLRTVSREILDRKLCVMQKVDMRKHPMSRWLHHTANSPGDCGRSSRVTRPMRTPMIERPWASA